MSLNNSNVNIGHSWLAVRKQTMQCDSPHHEVEMQQQHSFVSFCDSTSTFLSNVHSCIIFSTDLKIAFTYNAGQVLPHNFQRTHFLVMHELLLWECNSVSPLLF